MANEANKPQQAAAREAAQPSPARTDAPVAAPMPNLTRDQIEITLAARYELEGKSKDDAAKLAKSRALKMVA